VQLERRDCCLVDLVAPKRDLPVTNCLRRDRMYQLELGRCGYFRSVSVIGIFLDHYDYTCIEKS